MGGGYYDRDVSSGDTSSGGYGGGSDDFDYGDYSTTAEEAMDRPEVHPDLLPQGRTLRCDQASPVVVAMDVTRSRGDDSKIIYDKMPMLFGQINIQGYLDDPAISFAAIGDATSGDRAPMQVCDFATRDKLDEWLTKIWLEEGGGGTGQESYELMAYFYANRCELPGSEKGFFFFTGDEGFYPEVGADQIAEHIAPDSNDTGARSFFSRLKEKLHLTAEQVAPDGDTVSTKMVFAHLMEKFHVFFVYPKKKVQQRRADIDAEIADRLQREGGKSGDIRASLIWNNRNDLDLHVVAPSGEEIYYAHKNSDCGGELDVDMNVSGETTKPVENIYWPRGGAPLGHYKVFVRNYGYHEGARGKTEFRVELLVNGEVTHFNGTVSGTGESSDVVTAEFDYTGSAENTQQQQDVYSAYDDATVLAQWAEVIPRENILILDEPKGIVDAILGAIALTSETRDLDAYLIDMQNRGQTQKRIGDIKKTFIKCSCK